MGKGESHSHPYHVDIQVGSCICLNVFGCHYMCTYVGSSPSRIIQLLGIAHSVEGKIVSGTEGSPGDGTHPRS